MKSSIRGRQERRGLREGHDHLLGQQRRCPQRQSADSTVPEVFARQYFARCHVESDVDIVSGRATAVYEGCHFRTLNRTDLASAPYGFVLARRRPSPTRTASW